MEIIGNRDTNLSELAIRLNEYLKKNTLQVNEETANLCDKREWFVFITNNPLNEEIEKVIKKIEFVPCVILWRSPEIGGDFKGLIQRELRERVVLTPLDGGVTETLEGRSWFTVGELQIVVIARQKATNIEIGDAILRFFTDYARTKSRVLYEHKGVCYTTNQLIYIELVETWKKKFSSSIDTDIALAITGLDIDYKEKNIRLESEEFKLFSTNKKVCLDDY